MEVTIELKDKLKDLRTKANLTQEDLANQLFVSRTLISKWENGDRYPNRENIARLCVFFQVSQEELVGGQQEIDKYNRYNILSIIFFSYVFGTRAFSYIYAYYCRY